jgi:hypothetical protein
MLLDEGNSLSRPAHGVGKMLHGMEKKICFGETCNQSNSHSCTFTFIPMTAYAGPSIMLLLQYPVLPLSNSFFQN